MSRIKWQFEQKRVAILKTVEGNVHVGDVEEYNDHEGLVNITVKLMPGLLPQYQEICETKPELLTIMSMVSAPRNILIIPTIEIPPGS